MTARARRLLLRAGVIALVIGACVLAVRGLDGRAILAALRAASWPLVALALGCIVAGSAAQMLRTQLFLRPTADIPLRRLVRYQLASSAASNLLPARAGEALRAYLLRAREGVPIATTAGLVVAEYAVKGVTLLALVLPVPWLVQVELPLPSRTRLLAIGAALAVAVLAVIIVARRARRASAPPWLRNLAGVLRATARGRLLAAILALTTAAWLCEAIAIVLVARALGHEISLAGAVLVLVTLNLALVVPSTPGRLGVFELGAAFGLRLLGLPETDALAAALLCHLIQFVPTTLLGLAGLPLALSARRSAPVLPPPPVTS